MKFCEVAKYYIQPNLAMAGTDVIVINKEAFNACQGYPDDAGCGLRRGVAPHP